MLKKTKNKCVLRIKKKTLVTIVQRFRKWEVISRDEAEAVSQSEAILENMQVI